MSLTGLACSWWSPVPHAPRVLLCRIGNGREFVCIDALLDLEILLNVDESLLNTLLWSQLEYLLVSLLCLTLNILSSWLDSKLPGSFDPGLFL